ncbi:hypothetical protein N657DRAFT_281411 [Parathielavia appendiculata]|uniref:Uncharacterized protein n=1 Tax=Parathielavia appendiculata TaxID=2587402 RepID=A0AAN6U3P8_9PEZI|nr:hypothetical protein N657DRAFT_281411 [Parathielavia appendiculata]
MARAQIASLSPNYRRSVEYSSSFHEHPGWSPIVPPFSGGRVAQLFSPGLALLDAPASDLRSSYQRVAPPFARLSAGLDCMLRLRCGLVMSLFVFIGLRGRDEPTPARGWTS